MNYTAFISYNSKDDKWAKWLQRKLESYSIPVRMRSELDIDEKQRKTLRVFRYRADLNTISLNEGLAHELDEARWLIVICSPNSAKSKWVGKEIQHFINTGRKDKILPFIVDGTSYSNDENECLNPVLKAAFPDGDILGVNIDDYGDDPRIYRRRKALVRTVSILIEVPDAYGYLWNRYRRRFWERTALMTAGALCVTGLLIYALNYHSPFNTKVQLREQSAKNELLPAPDSLFLKLALDNEVKQLVLTALDDPAVFMNIPGKYVGKQRRLTFNAYGYMPFDTLVKLERNNVITVEIHRDDTFGVLAGVVIDEQGTPLMDVRVETAGTQALTDKTGYFELHIPLEKQNPKPHVIISKAGYQTEDFSEQAVGRNWNVMLLRTTSK